MVSPRKEVPRRVRIGCMLLLVCAAIHAADMPIGGGDTLVALSSGRYMVGPWAQDHPHRTWQMRLLDTIGIHISKQAAYTPNERPTGSRDDFLSLFRHSWQDRPRNVGWVNQNWLGHLTFYGIDRFGGGRAVVAFKLVLAVLMTFVVYRTGIAMGAHPVTAALPAAWSILVSRSFLDIRPNLISIFCVALMFLILARWRRAHCGAVGWLAPLMVVWSNVHGGFIYGVMVFCILAGAHLAQWLFATRWPHVFARVTRRQYAFLLVGLALVVAIPATFSPFGQENLFHFLHVTLGEDGRLWRSLLEWLPISHPKGFGNATPYLFFVGATTLMLLAWVVLRIAVARRRRATGRSRQAGTDRAALPSFDLAQFAVMGVTVAMSFRSRRFIFLAAIVLAPYLAALAQEALILLRHYRGAPARGDEADDPPALHAAVVAAPFAAAIPIALAGLLTLWTVYFRAPLDGNRATVFDRMVGVVGQPVAVMQFLNTNGFEGLILNGWSDGGYIALHQPVDPQTGETPCQVFIDGRCQNAYDTQHYKNYRRIMKLDSSIAGNSAKADRLLKHHGVNLALLKPVYSKNLLQLLITSGNWTPVCIDGDWLLLLCNDDPRNTRHVIDEFRYPNDRVRTLSVGARLCLSQTPADRDKGIELLKSADPGRSMAIVHGLMLAAARAQNRMDDVRRHFEEKRKLLLDSVNSGERFGRLSRVSRLISICGRLKALALKNGQPRMATQYGNDVNQYRELSIRLGSQSLGQSLW